ncbi:hypothetical protein [Aporhodopirellula aestuarii]|uniref:HEAT repeat domain-containing protein n=1 Tax=Aporhodopirellula aestuarii TaxID=2950107 RepID=A0ABT0U9X8_9BACT|nr:hypothetical protein [Aporhodopirellula aestuarii]MCM2373798.1 hypothetical protein [Aporhodopirellula aestuarii]
MNQRDRVAKLTKTDFAGAFKLACSISDVRERIQSFGWVARYAPAAEVSRVIDQTTKSAGTSSDFYVDTMALAWPLRALHETGHGERISSLLTTALRLSREVRPTASRAEAIVLLIHAVLPHGLRTAAPAITALKATAADSHWRVVRALVDVALLVNAFDQKSAIEIANVIPVEHKRKSAIDRISGGETLQPRPFFW